MPSRRPGPPISGPPAAGSIWKRTTVASTKTTETTTTPLPPAFSAGHRDLEAAGDFPSFTSEVPEGGAIPLVPGVRPLAVPGETATTGTFSASKCSRRCCCALAKNRAERNRAEENRFALLLLLLLRFIAVGLFFPFPSFGSILFSIHQHLFLLFVVFVRHQKGIGYLFDAVARGHQRDLRPTNDHQPEFSFPVGDLFRIVGIPQVFLAVLQYQIDQLVVSLEGSL
mmetsp:Transcript_14971/g.30876  ORF Transcript_14971/g.30876 Transcript_14971/m.30876 type:complete len:226 (+) Transcript_14971:1421-2098(+)